MERRNYDPEPVLRDAALAALLERLREAGAREEARRRAAEERLGRSVETTVRFLEVALTKLRGRFPPAPAEEE